METPSSRRSVRYAIATFALLGALLVPASEGFVGHFQGRERQAVATGTVVVDSETVVDGSTPNARIETLEDNNITTGA